MHSSLCIAPDSLPKAGLKAMRAATDDTSKYFELKNSWGARAPLNSNYVLASNFHMNVQ